MTSVVFKGGIEFPCYSGVRCLMMPYVQGEPASVPDAYASYRGIIASMYVRKGDVGYLTIDESVVTAGQPHRGQRAKFGRALHTEAGLLHGHYGWGSPSPGWGSPRPSPGNPRRLRHVVTLDRDVRIVLANSINRSCAIWDDDCEDTSEDGDIGDRAAVYPYHSAIMMRAGDVYEIGILTPHESLSVEQQSARQFLRIVGSGVHGREAYFDENPRIPSAW